MPPAAASVTLLPLLNAVAGAFAGGRQLARRQKELGAYFGAEDTFLVSSGKAALAMTLRALRRLAPGRDEVLVPAYTCYSVPAAVAKAGLRVRLCDIDRETLDFDHSLLTRAVSARTLCVVTGNLLGIPSEADAVRGICRSSGAFLVEDAAQCLGGTAAGRRVGTAGDAAIFSFGRGKNVTCGSGGAIVTASKPVADAVRREYASAGSGSFPVAIAQFATLAALAVFLPPSRYWLPSLLPFLGLGTTAYPADFPVRKLSGVSAGALAGWQGRLAESNRARESNAGYFMDRLPTFSRKGVPYLRLPALARSRAERDRILALSARRGLGISALYPAPIQEVPELRDQFPGERFPVAAAVADVLYCLPTHEYVNQTDRDAICAAVASCLH